MAVVVSILCGLYGTYCLTFCCTLGYTMYNEHIDKKKKKNNRSEKTLSANDIR